MAEESPSTYADRIKLLETFLVAIRRWDSNDCPEDERVALRSQINRDLAAARAAVFEAGTLQLITATWMGRVAKDVNPFDMIFEPLFMQSLVPSIADMVEQAIGFYTHLDSGHDFVQRDAAQAIDIESAIERALRPSFREKPPSSEREVQDAVENILNTLGVDFVREKEAAPIGPRGFHPDFTVAPLNLAIEVKLATTSHSASEIQQELAADIAAYRTKWKRLLAIIYDTGVIVDPYQMRRDNIKHFGVSIVIVKH